MNVMVSPGIAMPIVRTWRQRALESRFVSPTSLRLLVLLLLCLLLLFGRLLLLIFLFVLFSTFVSHCTTPSRRLRAALQVSWDGVPPQSHRLRFSHACFLLRPQYADVFSRRQQSARGLGRFVLLEQRLTRLAKILTKKKRQMTTWSATEEAVEDEWARCQGCLAILSGRSFS